MTKGLLAQLNQTERLLWDETEPAALALLDEDQAADLLVRIRRARNKYTGQYRREASAKVGTVGGRGAARPKNTKNAARAEVFEEALSRVSRRLAVLSREAAAELRASRIAAAQAARGIAAPTPDRSTATSARSMADFNAPTRTRGDGATRSPRTERNRASTGAAGRRRQAGRDSR